MRLRNHIRLHRLLPLPGKCRAPGSRHTSFPNQEVGHFQRLVLRIALMCQGRDRITVTIMKRVFEKGCLSVLVVPGMKPLAERPEGGRIERTEPWPIDFSLLSTPHGLHTQHQHPLHQGFQPQLLMPAILCATSLRTSRERATAFQFALVKSRFGQSLTTLGTAKRSVAS